MDVLFVIISTIVVMIVIGVILRKVWDWIVGDNRAQVIHSAFIGDYSTFDQFSPQQKYQPISKNTRFKQKREPHAADSIRLKHNLEASYDSGANTNKERIALSDLVDATYKQQRS